MKHRRIILTLASVALFLPLGGATAQASKIVSKIPSQLRGSWYIRESTGTLNKYTLTRKSVISTSYEHGKKTFSQKAPVTTNPHWTTKPKILIRKGSHGWYGLSWLNANGLWSIKRGTYHLSGHTYKVLFNNETGMYPPVKKIPMNVGFKHALKKAHTTKISTKGMVTY